MKTMRWIIAVFCLFAGTVSAQTPSYIIGVKGDTLNRVDKAGKKQGKWINRFESVRGEPGYEEEGEYKDDRKEGAWRKYNLMGDLFAIENYRWGFKDGESKYFNISGNLTREESWRAFNPDKLYDTLDVEDPDHPGTYQEVVVKNEGSSVKHGTWRYYDSDGFITKTEFWRLGQADKSLDPPTLAKDTLSRTANRKDVKPKEVLEFEKKNAGKKKVKVRDGTVSY